METRANTLNRLKSLDATYQEDLQPKYETLTASLQQLKQEEELLKAAILDASMTDQDRYTHQQQQEAQAEQQAAARLEAALLGENDDESATTAPRIATVDLDDSSAFARLKQSVLEASKDKNDDDTVA